MHAKMATLFTVTSFALVAVLADAAPAVPSDPGVHPDARQLFAQLLSGFDDACEVEGDMQRRHVRFATLNAAGHVEDRLALRTTTQIGPTGPARLIEYLVHDVVMFTRKPGGEVQPTVAGLQLLHSGDARRVAKLLAAFAAAHPRIFANDMATPSQSCGATEGKPEEQAKCAAIAVLGCATQNPFVCLASGGAAILCNYAIEKACEVDPDSCQPGWTEG